MPALMPRSSMIELRPDGRVCTDQPASEGALRRILDAGRLREDFDEVVCQLAFAAE